MKELTEHHLLLKISQGKGKANRLYVFVPYNDYCIEEEKEPVFAEEYTFPEDSIYGREIKVVYDKSAAEIRPG